MDRSRGPYARVRSLYGATAGTYRLLVYGTRAAEYELRAIVTAPDETVVDEARSAALDVGETHAYELHVPESGPGWLRRATDRAPEPVVVGSAAVGGVVAGAAGYRTVSREDDRT
jgi:hypothetical protein